MTTCSAEEKYVSAGTGKASHLLRAMEVLGWSTVCAFLASLMTSRAWEVARLGCASMNLVSGISENETLRPPDGVRAIPGAWSAFLRTVRDGVRDRAREDQNPCTWYFFLFLDCD